MIENGYSRIHPYQGKRPSLDSRELIGKNVMQSTVTRRRLPQKKLKMLTNVLHGYLELLLLKKREFYQFMKNIPKKTANLYPN
jgi:hypothetical protein